MIQYRPLSRVRHILRLSSLELNVKDLILSG